MTIASEVSAKLVIQRVKRHLSKRGLSLKEGRPATDEAWKHHENCFRWVVVDTVSNRVLLENVSLEDFARAIGEMHYWENCSELPSPGPGF